jgi:AraC-like DNA-binding protein
MDYYAIILYIYPNIRLKVTGKHMKNAIEIVLDEEIQKIFDHFAAGFGVTMMFFDPDGTILRRGMNRANSRFCQLIQDDIFGPESCLVMDESKRQESIEKQGIVNYRCHAGIEEAIAPIYVEKQLAGFAMIGQFRSGKAICPAVYKACPAESRKELEAAFHALPYFEPERVKDVLGLFSVMTDYIITKEIIQLRGDRIVHRVLGWIEDNLHHRIKLDDAAKFAHRSRSTISHLFRRELKMSFQQSVIEARLERAEKYFRESPDSTIAEIASRVGIEDQYYFSRLYRKNRGQSPTQYRDSFK